jgi:hypothetical protein
VSDWTSLEIAKFAVSIATPLAVVGLGVVVARATNRLEQRQWANQKVVDYRLQIFQELAPPLNRLYCFFLFVGRWKEITVEEVIALKRQLDEQMHVSRLLFSPDVYDSYNLLMEAMFDMWVTPNDDALLRAQLATARGDRRLLDWWTPALERRFVSAERRMSLDDIQQQYDAFASKLRADLYST